MAEPKTFCPPSPTCKVCDGIDPTCSNCTQMAFCFDGEHSHCRGTVNFHNLCTCKCHPHSVVLYITEEEVEHTKRQLEELLYG